MTFGLHIINCICHLHHIFVAHGGGVIYHIMWLIELEGIRFRYSYQLGLSLLHHSTPHMVSLIPNHL